MLFQKAPNYAAPRVYGCCCYPFLRHYPQHKFEPSSLPCAFLGYSSVQKGYKCLHLPTGKIFLSRHVIFYERRFVTSSATTTAYNDKESFSYQNYLPVHTPIVVDNFDVDISTTVDKELVLTLVDSSPGLLLKPISLYRRSHELFCSS